MAAPSLDLLFLWRHYFSIATHVKLDVLNDQTYPLEISSLCDLRIEANSLEL